MDDYIMVKVVVTGLIFIGVVIFTWVHWKQLSILEDADGQQTHTKEKKYYQSRQEALDIRSPGDRIYYDANEKAYYIVTPIRKPFWSV